MIIKLSPDDVTMETDTGSGQSMQSFVYKLDGSSIRFRARWDGKPRPTPRGKARTSW